MAFEDLDRAKVGECLINAMSVAAKVYHKSPRSTMKDYGGPDHLLSPEARFVRDALSQSTETIVDRWFGGNASEAGQYVIRKLADRRRRYLAEKCIDSPPADDRLDVLRLTPRVSNALHAYGVHTVSGVVAMAWYELMDVRGFGLKALAEVIAKLAERGLELKKPVVALPELPQEASEA